MTQRKVTNGFFHVVAVQRALQADPAEKVLAFRQAEMKGKAELHRMRTADRMMPIGKPLFDAAGHRDLRLFKPCADKSALFSRILLPFIAMARGMKPLSASSRLRNVCAIASSSSA